jgi:hypothetical protein
MELFGAVESPWPIRLDFKAKRKMREIRERSNDETRDYYDTIMETFTELHNRDDDKYMPSKNPKRKRKRYKSSLQ